MHLKNAFPSFWIVCNNPARWPGNASDWQMTTLGWGDFAKTHDRHLERSLNISLVSVTQNVVGPIEPEVPLPERTQKEVLGKAWNGSFHWCHGHFYNRSGDVPEIMLCILVSVTTSEGEESAGKMWGEVQLREGHYSPRIWEVPGGSWKRKSVKTESLGLRVTLWDPMWSVHSTQRNFWSCEKTCLLSTCDVTYLPEKWSLVYDLFVYEFYCLERNTRVSYLGIQNNCDPGRNFLASFQFIGATSISNIKEKSNSVEVK